MRTLALLTFPLLATSLLAQPAPHTRAIPKLGTGTFLGTASSFPLGRTGGRAQYWFRRDQIHVPLVLTAIGPRPSRNFVGSARTQSLEITMANSTLPHAQFTKDFANNLGAQARVVYSRKNLSIPAFPAHTDPDQPGVWITLDTPFVMSGPNLVLDFDLGPAASATGASYNGDLMTLAGAGRHITSDPSCGGTLAATTSATHYTLNVTGATPSQAVLFMLSTEATTWGPVPLPFKLDGIGMAGCVLGVDPQVSLAMVADGSGNASLPLPFATPAEAIVVYVQALHPSNKTTLGLATTNVARSILGSTGLCSYIYNFTVDGPLAQNGPNAWQGAMLLRP